MSPSRHKPSEPPSDDCIGCGAWQDTEARKRRSWLAPCLIGVAVTISLALGGGYLSLHFLARSNAAEVAHLREGRTEDREETRRIAADVAEQERAAAQRERESAERYARIESALSRIEGKLQAFETRRQR